MTHAGDLSTEKTLCGLPTSSNKCGWVFTEEGMRLNKGQMYNLFKEKVTCEECLKVAKEIRLKDTCETCGQQV